MKNIKNNPLIEKSNLPFEVVPFDKIKLEHFMPAIEHSLELAYNDIKEIINCKDEPTFDNTILALENSGRLMNDVATVFYNLMGSESDNDFKALAQEISPKLSEFSNYIYLNDGLFERIKKLSDKKDELNLTEEENRVLEETYKGFKRNGALLNEEDKKKLAKVNTELSKLSPQFSHNTINATNAFELVITDENELDGLPKSAKNAAKARAKAKDKEGWLFNLQYPTIIPILKYSKNRDLRKKISNASGGKNFNDKFDNQELIKNIVKLKNEKVKILGFKNFAEYNLSSKMAKNKENVDELLNRLYDVAMPAARKEVEELKELAKKDGIEEMQGWDSSFYSEKLKKQKFDFDEEKLKEYFAEDKVTKGIFDVCKKLYGLTFKEITNIPVYHETVRTYEVLDEKNEHVGVLYIDLFPRETKRGGAWMTTYRTQGLEYGEVKRPHVVVTGNFTPAEGDNPALLAPSEVRTYFHEFGHALHALLSDCKFKSIASPNVYWDFVELPSQIFENWFKEKEVLELFAYHYKTNELIPEEEINKLKALDNFQAGMATIRQVSFGMLDMNWYTSDIDKIEDVAKFENDSMEKTRLFPRNDKTNMSTSFGHIFAGGYSAGYYSYKWAEVLEADAFEVFKKNGIFDRKTAESFKNNILSQGNKKHPMELFKAFTGQEPNPDALLRRCGLIK